MGNLLEAQGDVPLLLQRLGVVLRLPKEVRTAVSAIPDLNYNRYLGTMDRIETVLSVNLAGRWDQVSGQLTDEALARLEFCDELLSRQSRERRVAGDELTTIAADIAQLIEDTLNANDLDSQLREVIVRRLRDLQRAIDEYRISGPEGLRRMMDAAVGALITDPDVRMKANEATNHRVVKGFVAVVLSIGGVLGAVNQGFTLEHNIFGLPPASAHDAPSGSGPSGPTPAPHRAATDRPS